MSVLMPDNLRYIKRNQLEQEQYILANYYQDLIRSYGIDVTYIRRNTSFETSGINSDLIYGHKENPTFDLSANMITFMEVDSSVLAINSLGLIGQDELTFYFSINDFGVCFSPDIGQFAEYEITPISGYLPYNTNNISLNFTSPVIDGKVTYNLNGETSGNNIFVSPVLSSLSSPSYTILSNPYINSSFSSTITGGYACPNIYLSFNKGLYKGCNRTFYSLSGTVLYHDLYLAIKSTNKIMPNVGDLVRIDFPGNEQLEEYEINEVLTRKPTSNEGINPLLGKYIWKCKATRRISSYENIINSDIQNENSTEDFMDIVKKESHNKNSPFKLINDYSQTNNDEIYGGYESSDILADDPDRYVQTAAVSGSSILQNFNNNTSLLSDGLDLYFKKNNEYINLTNNQPISSYSENTFPSTVLDIMYLKVSDGNIYFCNEYNMNKVTDFSYINKKEHYSFDFVLNNVNKKYNLNNSSFYIFKNDKYAIFSNGTNLIAINYNGEEYIIA